MYLSYAATGFGARRVANLGGGDRRRDDDSRMDALVGTRARVRPIPLTPAARRPSAYSVTAINHARTADRHASGRSRVGRWPQSSSTTSRASRTRAAIASAVSTLAN
jgi:hypothetical protein